MNCLDGPPKDLQATLTKFLEVCLGKLQTSKMRSIALKVMDVSDIFYFIFNSGGGEGESEAPGRGRGSAFY